MVLNYIWISFFLIGSIVAAVKCFVFGQYDIFSILVSGVFDDAKKGFEVCLGLTGILSLWMGFMKIGENAGVIQVMARMISPFFQKIFPEIPKNHPVYGTIMLNISANMLGLDNAATPMGLKAMSQMQELNKDKETASNAQIMFLVLNTSGLTIIPITIMMYRAQYGAASPTDIFIPILIATFFSTLFGFLAVAVLQKINLFTRTMALYLGTAILAITGIILYFNGLPKDQVAKISDFAGNAIIFSVIISFIAAGLIKKINVFDSFIEGAKEGFGVAIKIVPFLIAILVAVGIFRNVGALDFIIKGFAWFFGALGFNTDFVGALPTAIMKPLSGTGARGMMIEAMQTNGADSFVGRLSCIFQGAADTTFYIVAVYFGSVGIKRTRYAIGCGLFADLAGVIAGIIIAYAMFH